MRLITKVWNWVSQRLAEVYGKLLLSLLLFFLLPLIGLMIVRDIPSDLENQFESRLIDIAYQVKGFLEVSEGETFEQQIPIAEKYIQSFESKLMTRVRIRLLNNYGCVLYDSFQVEELDTCFTHKSQVRDVRILKTGYKADTDDRSNQLYDKAGNPLIENPEVLTYFDCALAYSDQTGPGEYNLKGIIYISGSTKEIMEKLYRIRDSLIIIVVLGGIITISILAVIWITVIRPLRALSRGARQLAIGNWDVSRDLESLKGRDEVGQLTKDFLVMANTIKGKIEFITGLARTQSHEFKTPLTAIQGAAELLRDSEKMTPDHQKRFLNNIMEECERLNRMVDETLVLARLDKELGELKLETKDVNNILLNAVKSFEAIAAQRNISLVFEPSSSPLYAAIDSDKLRRAVDNLFSNSYKFVEENTGQISIILSESEEMIRIAVNDNGSGMSEKMIPKIFDRFYTSKKNPAGLPSTGLGLPIVKDIVNAFGGEIMVESTLGVGTTMTILLPIDRENKPK